MSANLQPTVGQAMSLRADAIAKGVTREQWQKGGAQFSIALDAIKEGGRLKKLPPIVAPSWGRIHFVDDVPVQLDRDWCQALEHAGPYTPIDYIVRQVGHLYPPTDTGLVRANFVLLNLTGGSYQRALNWAKKYDLPSASPRHVFALAEYKPTLHRELDMDPMYIVSPEERGFEGSAPACSVWFSGERRKAHASWTKDFGLAYAWVVFLRE